MDRQELETLLEGLPATEGHVLSTARSLEDQDLQDSALDLLARAARRGAGDRTRMALAQRLLSRGRVMAALAHIKDLEDLETHLRDACILRAQASHHRKRPEETRVHLDRAALAGLSEEGYAAWEAHFFGEEPPPVLDLLDEDTETFPDAPTNLFDLNNETRVGGESCRPDEAPTSVRSRRPPRPPEDLEYAAPDEPTTIKTVDEAELEAIANEETVLGTFSEELLDGPPRSAASRDAAARVPATLDRAQELPRYVTDPAAAESPSPSDRFEIQGILADPLDPDEAFDASSSHRSLAEISGELELDSPRLNPRRPSREAPPARRQSSIRQFTVMVREKALQSPLQAGLIALATSLIVVVGGLSVIYGIIARAQINNQLDAIEHAIDADLYSSHLAGLRDARALQNYSLIPIGPVERLVRATSRVVPGISVQGRLAHAQDLEYFIEARIAARFVPPEPRRLRELPANPGQLAHAAQGYELLARGDHRAALELADTRLTPPEHRFVLLAFGDILADAGDAERQARTGRSFPEVTPATSYTKARLLLNAAGGDPRYLEEISDRIPAHHVGFQLLLAEHAESLEEALELVGPLRDPGHAHAAPLERARAHLIEASFHARTQERSRQRRALEAALQSAPHAPEALSPMVDFLLGEGDLEEARGLLFRVPGGAERPPFVDITLGRIHVASGEYNAAIERLEPHSLDHMEATLLLAVAAALRHDGDRALALLDHAKDSDGESGRVLRGWMMAHRGQHDEAATHLFNADASGLAPHLRALLEVDGWRMAANLAGSRADALERYERAAALLEELPQDSPEHRLHSCLLALDRRDASAADSACPDALSMDRTSRAALQAAYRWHRSRGDLDGADEAIASIIQRAGNDGQTTLLQTRQAIARRDFDEARQLLDDLGVNDLGSPDHLAVEGLLALEMGRFDRAMDRFDSALRGAFLAHTEAILGKARAELEAGDYDADQVESALRLLLRDGALAPQAWTHFARLRREQNRLRDARENLGFAHNARGSFGPPEEALLLVVERAALEARSRSTGHAQVRRHLDEALESDVSHWALYWLAGEWEMAQRRPDLTAATREYRRAMELAPYHCELWDRAEELDPERLRNAVLRARPRPTDC